MSHPCGTREALGRATGRCWGAFGRLWALLGCPGALSRRPKGAPGLENERGASTGCYFSYFQRFAHVSRPGALWGCFWRLFGRSWMLLEHTWAPLGRPRDASGRPWGAHEPPLWHSRGTWTRYWALLGCFWAFLGASGVPRSAIKAPKGAPGLQNERGASIKVSINRERWAGGIPEGITITLPFRPRGRPNQEW